MPPNIALLLCICFILFLFKIDFRRESKISHSLWITLLWMILIGSKYVSGWLNMGNPISTPEAYLEGSPLDRNIFLILIVAGLLVLLNRKISWSQIFLHNQWIFLLFLYSGISIMWSDFRFVSFKRWIKATGNLVMVLVVLTESDPIEGVKKTISRCAYILIPLSILFIKYYPHLGKVYNPWTGAASFVGVTTSKNMFGNLCLVCGYFFFWNLITIWRKKNIYLDKKEVFINISFLIMILWLFKKIDSVTSFICLILGICLIIFLGFPSIKRNRRYITIYFILIILSFMILDFSLNLKHAFILNFGRDETLTGRVELWKDVISISTDPLFGTGFYSFWLGNRLEKLWEKHWWRPNQAHNGYLEIYLNLGLIGVFCFIGLIISVYRKIHKRLLLDFDYGRFRMGFLAIALVYNFTEVGCMALHLVWFIFLLIATDISGFINNDAS